MLGENLRQIRKRNGETQIDLAHIIGVTQTTVSQYENGTKTPSFKTLMKIASHYRVSTDYLMGESENNDAPRPSVPGARWIPVLGNVPAGTPIEAVQDILDYEEISPEMAASGEFFALRVKGDSMAPRIMSGDVLIVRRCEDCENGQVAVVMVNSDEATVKRVRKDQYGGLMLLPDNAAYEPGYFSAEEVRTLPVTIIGVVVERRGPV